MKELLKYLLSWPAYVLAFMLVGTGLIKAGEFIVALFEDIKNRRSRK